MRARSIGPAILESGDRLNRAEFHRLYCEQADIKKAELVEGVVYVASPVRLTFHGQPHAWMITWLGTYAASRPELQLGDNATVLLDDRNEVQPDAFLLREEPAGPQLTAAGYVEGAPQLVVEIAGSSAAVDLHDKMEAYRRNGVREYIVWNTMERIIDWFRLENGEYVWVEPVEGAIESSTFSGLVLNVVKMVQGDLAAVLAALDRA